MANPQNPGQGPTKQDTERKPDGRPDEKRQGGGQQGIEPRREAPGKGDPDKNVPKKDMGR